MAYHWPADTVFRELTLEVDDRTCWQCEHLRTVCCHRQRRFFTCAGPVQLVCKLCHCSNPACSEHHCTVSPEEETALVMPYWVLGWDVFCWLGQPLRKRRIDDMRETPMSCSWLVRAPTRARYGTSVPPRHRWPSGSRGRPGT